MAIQAVAGALLKQGAKQAAKQGAKQAAKKAAKSTAKRDRTREYARNKARRALTRLEKQVEQQKGGTKAETKQQIRELRETINNSFYNRETKSYMISTDKLSNIATSSRERVEQFERYLHTDSDLVNQRKTRQMEAYFRSASLSEAQRQSGERKTPEQRLARAQQEFFYRMTQTIWQGNTTPDDRNNYIVDVLRNSNVRLESGRKVQNLTDAVQYIQETFPNFPTMNDVLANPNLGETFEDSFEYTEVSPDMPNYSEWKRLGVNL